MKFAEQTGYLFGMQDFDEEVQRRVNRIQPSNLFDKILTPKVRDIYKEIAFDLLIGQRPNTRRYGKNL